MSGGRCQQRPMSSAIQCVLVVAGCLLLLSTLSTADLQDATSGEIEQFTAVRSSISTAALKVSGLPGTNASVSHTADLTTERQLESSSIVPGDTFSVTDVKPNDALRTTLPWPPHTQPPIALNSSDDSAHVLALLTSSTLMPSEVAPSQSTAAAITSAYNYKLRHQSTEVDTLTSSEVGPFSMASFTTIASEGYTNWPLHPKQDSVPGVDMCMVENVCTQEGEYCNSHQNGSYSCVCHRSYYRSSEKCLKITFYMLLVKRANNSSSFASDDSKSPAPCCKHIKEQLLHLLSNLTTNLTDLELQSQRWPRELQGRRSQHGPWHLSRRAASTDLNRVKKLPEIMWEVLLGFRGQPGYLKQICEHIGMNGSFECISDPAAATVNNLCQFQMGHDCDVSSAQCAVYNSTTVCHCKSGYSPVPESKWMCSARCSPDEKWDVVAKKCQAKCTPSHCRNSGTCFPTKDSYICSCPSSYEGAYCEQWSGRKYEDLKWVTIGIGIGTIILLLLLFAAVIIVCCSEKRRSDFQRDFCAGSHQYELDRYSWFPPIARAALKSDDVSSDSMEMMEHAPLEQLSRVETKPMPKVSDKCCREHDHFGTENGTYIPEAEYDLDVIDTDSSSAQFSSNSHSEVVRQ